MKPWLTIEEFLPFFNSTHLTATTGAASITIGRSGYSASLVVRAEQEYRLRHTIRFVLKFEHKRPLGGRVFQREFMIEHHHGPGHGGPHIQIRIHGPEESLRVGELWFTLLLASEEEYRRCVRGFIAALARIVESRELGISAELLDLEAVRGLGAERDYLLRMIGESLRRNGIEHQGPDGIRRILSAREMAGLASRDAALPPLLG